MDKNKKGAYCVCLQYASFSFTFLYFTMLSVVLYAAKLVSTARPPILSRLLSRFRQVV